MLLDYMVGKRVLDIGPGGGVLLDLIEQEKPEAEAIGIDISANVIEALERKKQRESSLACDKRDALQLISMSSRVRWIRLSFPPFCMSCIRILSVPDANLIQIRLQLRCKVLFGALPGGRILIRDGIMSEPQSQNLPYSISRAGRYALAGALCVRF